MAMKHNYVQEVSLWCNNEGLIGVELCYDGEPRHQTMAQHVPSEDPSSKEDDIYCETLTMQNKERIISVRGYFNGSFITGLEVETNMKNKL